MSINPDTKFVRCTLGEWSLPGQKKVHAFSGVVVVVVVNSDPWFVSDLVKKMQEVEGLDLHDHG